jgi:hypothetical protein
LRGFVALLFVMLLVGPALGDEPMAEREADRKARFIWIPPSGYYGNWVFLLQGFYSGLDGIGVGAEVTRPFKVPLLSGYADSDIELEFRGRLYEQAHGEFEASADATFAQMRWSVRAQFEHSTRLREFWGVGPDTPSTGREKYRPRDMRTYVECMRNIEYLRIGLRLELHDYMYLTMEPDGLLENGDYLGVRSTGETAAGVGLTWDYDSTDDRYAPTKGWRLRGNVMGFDVYRKGESMFLNANIDARTYLSTSPKNVFALQFFAYGVNGTAPVWRYSAIGGRAHSRGYSRNRYLDQKLAAIQCEWRRHVYRQLGLQLFAGTAVVSPAWSKVQIRYQHPTVGAGVSLVIPQVSSLAIRGELAMGDDRDVHARLDLGLAF